MNLSSFTSPPADPSPYNNFRPLLISGGIVVGVTVFLLAIHFILSRSDPHHAPARSDPTGEDVEKVLVLIPVIPYAKEKQSRSVSVRDCSVCLSAMAEGEKVRILPGCGHGFHVQCIDEWLRNQLNCPICRLPVMPPQTCVDIPLMVAQAASAAAGPSKPCEPCCNRELSC